MKKWIHSATTGSVQVVRSGNRYNVVQDGVALKSFSLLQKAQEYAAKLDPTFLDGPIEFATDIQKEEMPAGFLKTSKFTAPSIKTPAQRNALEAFEIAVTEKFKQFDGMLGVQMGLTSGTGWSGVIDEYPEGYYIQINATRSNFQAFVQGDHVIRKPRVLSDKVAHYNIDGDGGTVYFMSSGRINT